MKGLLVIGHGSRAFGAREVFNRTVSGLREKTEGAVVEGCFMELSKPSIPEAIEKMYGEGIREITVLPYFLFPGIHILEDIPKMLESKKNELKSLEICVASPIGFDDKLVDILKERAEGDLTCI